MFIAVYEVRTKLIAPVASNLACVAAVVLAIPAFPSRLAAVQMPAHFVEEGGGLYEASARVGHLGQGALARCRIERLDGIRKDMDAVAAPAKPQHGRAHA
ncbi:hypothetical protein AMJ85_02015, partial [candidate division BRC1 bacterium SM23_51]